MDGVIIVFYLPKGSPVRLHRNFRKRIYGEETSAGGGRWRYRRRGLLDAVPHILVYSGVVILRPEDESRFRREVRKYGGTIFRRQVKLITEDARALGVPLG